MWSVQCERLDEYDGLRYRVEFDAVPASFRDVADAWRNDADFCHWFNDLLAAVSSKAFRWETPAVTRDIAERQQFEFVVLDSPDLARRPDRTAFAEHFEGADGDAVAFANLGADALLVAPPSHRRKSLLWPPGVFRARGPCSAASRSVGPGGRYDGQTHLWQTRLAQHCRSGRRLVARST